MVNLLPHISTALGFLKATPADQQALVLTNMLRSFGPQFFKLNDQQVEVIIDAFSNTEILDEHGIPNQAKFEEFQQKFQAAASPAVPVRIICKHCKTLNRV